MDRFANLAVVSRLQELTGVGESLRSPRGLFALIAVAFLILYGLSVGRTRALVSLLSIYVAYVLALLFPFGAWVASRVPEQYRTFMDAGLFIACYLLAFGLIGRSMRKTRLTLGEISFVQVLLISFVQVGLLACIAVSLLPDAVTANLGRLAVLVKGTRALWIWAVASLAILPLMRARRKE